MVLGFVAGLSPHHQKTEKRLDNLQDHNPSLIPRLCNLTGAEPAATLLGHRL